MGRCGCVQHCSTAARLPPAAQSITNSPAARTCIGAAGGEDGEAARARVGELVVAAAPEKEEKGKRQGWAGLQGRPQLRASQMTTCTPPRSLPAPPPAPQAHVMVGDACCSTPPAAGWSKGLPGSGRDTWAPAGADAALAPASGCWLLLLAAAATAAVGVMVAERGEGAGCGVRSPRLLLPSRSAESVLSTPPALSRCRMSARGGGGGVPGGSVVVPSLQQHTPHARTPPTRRHPHAGSLAHPPPPPPRRPHPSTAPRRQSGCPCSCLQACAVVGGQG